MKKLLTTIALICTLAVVAHGAEDTAKKSDSTTRKRPALSAEQRALRKELVEKYDTNKNKRLDKEERSKMTAEDQKKWDSVSPAPKAKPAKEQKDK